MIPYHRLSSWKSILTLLLFVITVGCRSGSGQQDQTQQPYQSENRSAHDHHKHHRNRQKKHDTPNTQEQPARVSASPNAVPAKVFDVLRYVRQNNRAPDGYVGGRKFGNFENHLPKQDASGQQIRYQEWDVNPKVQGRNRGVERLITGSDNKAYFTADHYNTFTEIK